MHRAAVFARVASRCSHSGWLSAATSRSCLRRVFLKQKCRWLSLGTGRGSDSGVAQVESEHDAPALPHRRPMARLQVTRTEFSHQVWENPRVLPDVVLPMHPQHAPPQQQRQQTHRAPAESPEQWRGASARNRGASSAHASSAWLRGSMSAPAHLQCVAYCTAETYDWDALLKGLQKDMVPSIYFSEVIHVSVPKEAYGEEGDVFFFRDGSMVLWDVSPERTRQLFATIEPFQVCERACFHSPTSGAGVRGVPLWETRERKHSFSPRISLTLTYAAGRWGHMSGPTCWKHTLRRSTSRMASKRACCQQANWSYPTAKTIGPRRRFSRRLHSVTACNGRSRSPSSRMCLTD
jgi:hypothetical protein